MTPEGTIDVLWAAWLVLWGIAAFWSNRTVKRGGIFAEVAFRIVFYTSSIFLLASFSSGRYCVRLWQLAAAPKWVLAALTAIGFLFTCWARLHLGRLWSDRLTKKEGHQVVDTGPYRFVRHPIYAGLISAAFTTAVEKGTSFALIGAAAFTIAFYTRARSEERFLRAELGENKYDAYAHKTAMLVPFVGRPPK